MNTLTGKFRAQVVYAPGGSGGSTPSSGSGVRADITSWALLAAIVTTTLTKPQVVVWVEAATGAAHNTQLRAGTDATDTPNGVQRPTDYNAVTNAYVWYDA